MAAVDGGIDITLTNGKTLQVKACNTVGQRGRAGAAQRDYFVFTTHAMRERGNGGRRVKRVDLTADFVVMWCIGADFYIVPREVIGKRHTICIPGCPEGWQSMGSVA